MYQALYRKYRPTNFDEVVGQDIVVQTLKNSLKFGKTSHAYLFSGPRGVGKTSIAKILARTVNCLDLKDGNVCNSCKNCESILFNHSTDIIEIDAASNNGVDEIREIRNKINLVPSELKYKVYIIDEVHMLSIGAFNALLKTLEEPPDHVIFILATTDPHKVPITIVSRCQCFEFKRITSQEIVEKLKEIVEKENIEIDEIVLDKIAKISDGGMRDALGLLDKISSFSSERITIEDFNKLSGIVEEELRNQFILSVYEKNFVKIIEYIDEIYNCGKDFVIFSQDLMDELRNNLLDYYLHNVENYPLKFILSFISSLDQMLIDLKNSNNVRIMFEASILTFANKNFEIDFSTQSQENEKIISREIKQVKKNDEIIQKNEENEQKLDIKADNITKQDKNIAAKEKIVQKRNDDLRFTIVNNTFATAQKAFLLSLKEKWSKLNDFVLDRSYGAAACYLVDSTLRAVGDQELIITCNYESVLDRGLDLLSSMEELLTKLTDVHYHIAILTNQEWEQERSKFIETKNKGEAYLYRSIPADVKKESLNHDDIEMDSEHSSDLVQQAISIFGEDIVKISE